MSASPLTTHRATGRSTVALKALMAVTGFLMVGFLLAHMGGNLWVYAGQESFDTYAHHLRTLGEPMFPHKVLRWVLRIGLVLAVVGHIYAAVTLARRNMRAAGSTGATRYHTTKNRTGVQRTYASFTMRYGGVIILLFLVYHLLHLTANTIAPGGESHSPYERVVNGFEIWWVVLSYVVAMIAVALHLRHGLWSAAATLGANTSPRRRARLNQGAIALSLLITIGFLAPPISIFFGWIG